MEMSLCSVPPVCPPVSIVVGEGVGVGPLEEPPPLNPPLLPVSGEAEGVGMGEAEGVGDSNAEGVPCGVGVGSAGRGEGPEFTGAAIGEGLVIGAGNS